MIYTMEQIEKLYSSLQNTKEIARIKRLKRLKELPNLEKLAQKSELLLIDFDII